MGVINQKKSDSSLFFEFLHESHLMFMNILQGKSIHGTFLCIEAYGNSLHRTDIVYRTFLLKVGQRNLAMFPVHLNRSNGCGHLLNQRKTGIGILIICSVNHILQCGPAQASGIPCSHNSPSKQFVFQFRK